MKDRMPDLLELLGHRPVVCAEGYLFECERRGYLQAGRFRRGRGVPVLRSPQTVRPVLEEQVAWAAEADVDFIIAETFSWVGEALLALEAIRAAGLPAVITFAVHREGTPQFVAAAAPASRPRRRGCGPYDRLLNAACVRDAVCTGI